MEWTEVKITVPVKDTDKAGDIANMCVPYGIYIEDYSSLESEVEQIAHIDLIDEELLNKDRAHSVVHIYISSEENPAEAVEYLSQRYALEGIEHEIECVSRDDEDWANSWKRFFKPMKIGERLLVRPAWEKLDNPEGRKVLSIEPGAAFGSGTHETTRLCLEALDRVIKPGDTLLDAGCGSGILSIAALLLGAKSALGVDIDAVAVRTAKENGELNGFSEPEYTVACGNLTECAKGKYSVITANIVADVIIAFTDAAYSLLENGGCFITSGIIDIRADEVRAAIEKSGFEITETAEDGGWVRFTAKKN